MTVEEKVREIVEAMGLPYICDSWVSANERLDRYRQEVNSFPVCQYVQPVSGSLIFTEQGMVQDAPSCFIAFADLMTFQAKGEESQQIAERLKGLCIDFVERANLSGFFQPITGAIPYRVTYDDLDVNLCIVYMEIDLRERVGTCVEY